MSVWFRMQDFNFQHVIIHKFNAKSMEFWLYSSHLERERERSTHSVKERERER